MLILNSQRNKGQMCWLTLLSSERSCSLQCSHILSGGWQFLTETKPWFWFAPWIPLLLSLILPGRRLSEGWLRIPLTRGEPPLFHLWKGGAQMYRDAQECQNPLSNRLGTSQFFFGDTWVHSLKNHFDVLCAYFQWAVVQSKPPCLPPPLLSFALTKYGMGFYHGKLAVSSNLTLTYYAAVVNWEHLRPCLRSLCNACEWKWIFNLQLNFLLNKVNG